MLNTVLTDDAVANARAGKRAAFDRILAETNGDPGVRIALIDGVVDCSHAGLMEAQILQQTLNGVEFALAASAHATFIASMLVGRGRGMLGLCPDCTLLSIPVADSNFELGRLQPRDADARIATKVLKAVRLGASVIQLSLEFSPEMSTAFSGVSQAIYFAASRGIRTVVSAGNRHALGSSDVMHAPGAVPVGMAGADALPSPWSAIGISFGARGLLAPGGDIQGASPAGGSCIRSGTSFAATFVTAAFALLRSRFPDVAPDLVWETLLDPHQRKRRSSIVPPLLDIDGSLVRLQSIARKPS